MDLYTVDDTFKKVSPVDSFDSIVWTDRYSASGDVTLVLPASDAVRWGITEGIFLHTPASKEIMLIESINTKNKTTTAIGYSLIDCFKQRMFRDKWQSAANAWGFNATPAGNIINTILAALLNPGTYLTNNTLLTAAQGANEVRSDITLASAVAGSNIDISIPYGNLYDAIKAVIDADKLGFTLYPPALDGSGDLTFKAYRGLDRTTAQSTNGQVIFDPTMDNLSNPEEIRSVNGYKNVAYVWPNGITAQNQIVVVYAPGVTSAISGFDRRTLMVEASDVNVADYSAGQLANILAGKGRDALANNNYVKIVDGQIVPQSAYTYGTDYNLGDIVELRGITAGTSSGARITEYIRTQDQSGEKSYPTLSVVS